MSVIFTFFTLHPLSIPVTRSQLMLTPDFVLVASGRRRTSKLAKRIYWPNQWTNLQNHLCNITISHLLHFNVTKVQTDHCFRLSWHSFFQDPCGVTCFILLLIIVKPYTSHRRWTNSHLFHDNSTQTEGKTAVGHHTDLGNICNVPNMQIVLIV